LPQVKGGMKNLETMTKKWLRPMWEAASGGRTRQRALWRLCRETTAVMFSLRLLKRALSLPKVFSERLLFSRATCSPAGTRPPTLVGSKVLPKLMIFNVNSMICHFKNPAKKTKSRNIAARNFEANASFSNFSDSHAGGGSRQ
jgi:hypothetical protein